MGEVREVRVSKIHSYDLKATRRRRAALIGRFEADWVGKNTRRALKRAVKHYLKQARRHDSQRAILEGLLELVELKA